MAVSIIMFGFDGANLTGRPERAVQPIHRRRIAGEPTTAVNVSLQGKVLDLLLSRCDDRRSLVMIFMAPASLTTPATTSLSYLLEQS